MTPLEIIGMGAMNLDQLYLVERVLADGEIAVTDFASQAGGSAANTVCGLAKLGVSAGFVGVVGDDEAGRKLVDDLARHGVDVSQVKVKKGATGSTLCLSDRRGRRAIYVMPGANSLLAWEDIDPEYISQAKIFHLSSFVHQAQLELQKRLVAQLPPTLKISFAPGSLYAARGAEPLAPLLKRAHLLFVNRREMGQLTGEDFAAGARRCLEMGCHTVVITLGSVPLRLAGKESRTAVAGYILAAGKDGEYFIESRAKPGQPVVDTTGAGDAFAAGFIYGIMKGKNPAQCGLLAEIMARFCIGRVGAREGLPSLAELSAEYQAVSAERL
jgi:ribokinase